MFVYQKMGIWHSLDNNKLYPTPVWYGVDIEYANMAYQYK